MKSLKKSPIPLPPAYAKSKANPEGATGGGGGASTSASDDQTKTDRLPSIGRSAVVDSGHQISSSSSLAGGQTSKSLRIKAVITDELSQSMRVFDQNIDVTDPLEKVEKLQARIVQTYKPKSSKSKRRERLEDFLYDCTVYALTQTLAFIVMVLLIIWLVQHYDGFGFKTPQTVFNLHPLFMILGMIYILANCRRFDFDRLIDSFVFFFFHSEAYLFPLSQRIGVILRSFIYLILIVLVTIAVASTIHWHRKRSVAHFYTLHSWLGILTLTMLTIFLIAHYYANFSSKTSRPIKKSSRIQLRFFGIGLLLVAGITAVTGLNQLETYMSFWTRRHYLNESPSYRTLVNVIGMFLIVYVAFMMYIVGRKRERSRERAELQQHINMALDKALNKLEATGTFGKPEKSGKRKPNQKLGSSAKSIESPPTASTATTMPSTEKSKK